MALVLDRSGSLLLVRANGVLDIPDLRQLTDAIDARVARMQPFLVVGDALAVQGVSAPARRFVGEHRSAKLRAATHLDLGLLIALRSPIVRGAMTAISWLGGAFADLRTVETCAELGPIARAVHRTKNVPLTASDEVALDAFVRQPNAT